MPRHSKPSELALHQANGRQNGIPPGPNSSPMNLQGVDLGSFGGGFEHDVAAGLTPLPANQSQSPPSSPRSAAAAAAHYRDPSKNFLSNFKNRISPEQEQRQKKEPRRGSQEEDEYRSGNSSMSTKIYHLRRGQGSTPELSLVGSQDNVHKSSTEGEKPPSLAARPQPTPHHSEDSTTSSRRKDSNKPFRIGISRSKSTRRDSDAKSRPRPSDQDLVENQPPPATAPLQSDWPGSDSRMKFGKGKDNEGRGKSAERAHASESEETLAKPVRDQKSGGFKMGSKNVMSKAKSGGGMFLNRLGKFGRSASSHEREIPDSEYQVKVINQPLVEQTRITRISKQLSGCRDKTEYWMPALPWRCIDYLNTNCEEEGLYRIPGSGPQVKHWQRRFDTEHDIDLLSEEVRDTNEIASMLKAWLRELPTEIMPQTLQKDLATQLEKVNPKYKNVGEPAPQLLRDALSDLPPFNYYLLFAITCHLSLLLTNKDKNKMDLNNLAVCVGPCLNLERWLFNYLVGDWRHCWQGCYTEKEYLRIEERVEAGLDPEPSGSEHGDAQSQSSTAWAPTADDGRSEAISVGDERAISSGSGSTMSKPTLGSRDNSEHPMAYMPSGAVVQPNGTIRGVGLGIDNRNDDEHRRPRTADQRNAPDDGTIGSVPMTKSRSNSNSTTPRVGHNRSRSDLPATTPVKANANADWSLPVRQ